MKLALFAILASTATAFTPPSLTFAVGKKAPVKAKTVAVKKVAPKPVAKVAPKATKPVAKAAPVKKAAPTKAVAKVVAKAKPVVKAAPKPVVKKVVPKPKPVVRAAAPVVKKFVSRSSVVSSSKISSYLNQSESITNCNHIIGNCSIKSNPWRSRACTS